MNNTKYNNKLTDDEKIEVVKLYNEEKLGCNRIANKFGLEVSSIYKLLKRRGVKFREYSRKLYTVDENYFDKIDTEEKSYFLGLLYADGCNLPYKGKRYFQLTLHRNDEYLIEAFRKSIKFSGPIKNYPHLSTSILKISSKKLTIALNNLGCISKKSLVLQFPNNQQVPEHLMNHFIRGYFDGDGCIWITKNNKIITVDIVSSIDFCKGLNLYINKKLNINGCLNFPVCSKKRFMSLKMSHRKAMKFLKFIYYECNIYMKRKKDKFDIFIKKWLKTCDFSKNRCSNISVKELI